KVTLPTSVLDALLGRDALVVGVLDLAHLGDGVGDLDDLRWAVASGDVDVVGPVAQGIDDLGRVDPSPGAEVGQLVENHETMFALGDGRGGDLPRLLGMRLVVLEVG